MSPPLPDLRTVAIPAEFQDLFDGDRLSFMRAGRRGAPVLVLLHGIGANSYYWRHQFAALSEAYDLIAWNAPGYIETAPLRSDRPHIDDYVAALVAFLQAVGVDEPVAMVGNSFGTAIALAYAARYPQRVSKLALSGVAIGANAASAAEQDAAFRRRQAQFDAGDGADYARQIIDLVTGSKTPAAARTETLAVLAMTKARGYLAASFVPYSYDAFRLAPGITMPVLLYHGTEDKVAPLERSAARLAEVLNQAQLVTFEGYGHLPEVELPDQVNEHLREFLAGG